MTKNNMIFLFVLSSLCFFSCKKNQVCTCIVSATGYTETLNYTFNETDKKAKEECNSYEKNAANSISNNGMSGVNADCNLK